MMLIDVFAASVLFGVSSGVLVIIIFMVYKCWWDDGMRDYLDVSDISLKNLLNTIESLMDDNMKKFDKSNLIKLQSIVMTKLGLKKEDKEIEKDEEYKIDFK
jgi:hypothetical protein